MPRELKLILDEQEILFHQTTLEANTTIQLEKPYRTVYPEHIDTSLAAIEKANRLWIYAEREREFTINRIAYQGLHVSITKHSATGFYVSVYARRKENLVDSLTEAAQTKLEGLIREDAIHFYRLHIRDIKQETKARYVDYYLNQIATSRANLDRLESHLQSKQAILSS